MSLPRAYIEHVAIRVPDIDRHIDFFSRVLGLGIRDEQPAEGTRPRQVWVLGSVQLIEDPNFEGPEGRLAHLGIMVDDYEGVLARAGVRGGKSTACRAELARTAKRTDCRDSKGWPRSRGSGARN